ncbi:MAG: pyridoxal 5'-phosphate synthase glutaminase subunit PdxT [Armatimonadetes bacterium]|nr:pyridoxal 5'-phosphate synthase glutaminase subunit PdxT [Armatimonadota bacterium]
MKIGILALQGDVAEHAQMIRICGSEPVLVKHVSDLDGLAGIIIPGGESTTLGDLIGVYGFDEAIRKKHENGMGIFGTCAGMILLARKLNNGTNNQPRLGLLDVKVSRNAFGRQKESFECELPILPLDIPAFPAVFIRAPLVESVGPGVEILASLNGQPVLVRSERILAGAFHPELTGDTRVHRYFIDRVCG